LQPGHRFQKSNAHETQQQLIEDYTIFLPIASIVQMPCTGGEGGCIFAINSGSSQSACSQFMGPRGELDSRYKSQ